MIEIRDIKIKTCTKCKQSKHIDQFYKDKESKTGYRSVCKECWKLQPSQDQGYKNANCRKYRPTKPKIIKPVVIKCEYCVDCMFNHAVTNVRCAELMWNFFFNNQASSAWKREYRRVKEKQRVANQIEREKQRYKTDPQYRLNRRMKNAIGKSLRGLKAWKHWEELVGYSINDLLLHISCRLKPGMTMDNYGTWHIDHIIPMSVFHFRTPQDIDFKRAWALTNLRPMWGSENISKGNKLAKPFQPALLLAVNV